MKSVHKFTEQTFSTKVLPQTQETFKEVTLNKFRTSAPKDRHQVFWNDSNKNAVGHMVQKY
jgi:hypothetical protein